MGKLDCPACAGPDNAECETCGGTSEVDQATFDAFTATQEQLVATQALKTALSELPVENTPGVEQVISVTALDSSSITATVDAQELVWDSTSNSWK